MAKFNITHVTVEDNSEGISLIKYLDGHDPVTTEPSMTRAELDRFFKSRGWYYTGHSTIRQVGERVHCYGYAPRPNATKLTATIEPVAWTDPWAHLDVAI